MPRPPQGGFTSYPGGEIPQTLVVEAFGRLLPDMSMPGPPNGEEDLYSVFNARAELMGWSSTGTRRRSTLWGMNDAELTPGSDTARIGWVQVGLDPGVEPVVALPALVQCLDDALRRFGVVELTGLQVTGTDLSSSGSCPSLGSALNWFNVVPNARSGALIVIEDESLVDRAAAELVARLEWLNTGPFVFGLQVGVPDRHSGEAPGDVAPSPGRLGVSVTLPEWTAAAAAWALATVIDTTGTGGSDRRALTARVEVTDHTP